MISGTVILESSCLTFTLDEETQYTVTYSITDPLVSLSETKTVDARAFFVALGIALNFDGGVPKDINKAWVDAISVQPDNPRLRFIP